MNRVTGCSSEPVVPPAARVEVLGTARCRLTTWLADDWRDVSVLASDPQMMRHISHGKPWSDARCREFVDRQIQQYDDLGFCTYRMTVGGERTLGGVCGLQPTLAFDGIELTWWVARQFWGRGLARECAEAVVAHGRDDLGLSELLAVVDEDNAASCRIAEGLGMTVRETVDYAGFNVRVYLTR